MPKRNLRHSVRTLIWALGAGVTFAGPSAAQTVIEAVPLAGPITVDGDSADWESVPSHRVELQGDGGVGWVDLRFGVHGDMIYMLAVWADGTESRLHKPYEWRDEFKSYRRTDQLEDRFAINFLMSGEFSNSKLSGAEFTADVWHWKASRSDPAGIAHDKMWKVSRTPFEGANEFVGEDGTTIYLARSSDQGQRLYRPVKYVMKRQEIMPRYEVNLKPAGSIADVRAKGVWRNGVWSLEMARRLDTGHPDDAIIPASGRIPFAIAAFNDVDGGSHSVSPTIILRTGNYSN